MKKTKFVTFDKIDKEISVLSPSALRDYSFDHLETRHELLVAINCLRHKYVNLAAGVDGLKMEKLEADRSKTNWRLSVIKMADIVKDLSQR